MWIRADLKMRAKEVLRGNYWKALLVSIVIAIATGSGGSGGSTSDNGGNGSFPSFSPRQIVIFGGIVVSAFLLAILFKIFIGYALEVGGRRYFVKSARYEDNSRCFTFAFTGENYKGILPAMLLRSVYTFLWFLLLIIPGIIKTFAYSMVPYILAENPNMGAKEAIALSERMTDGHKFDIFILGLSFIGWYILGALVFGIGVIFVMPYSDATYAELYLKLRENIEVRENFAQGEYSNPM